MATTVTQKLINGKWVTVLGLGPLSGLRIDYGPFGVSGFSGFGIVNFFRTVTIPGVPSVALQSVQVPPTMAGSPNLDVSFDTWGSTIPYAIGNVRIAGHMIWAQGIESSGSVFTSPTLSCAVAFNYLLDPDEVVSVVEIRANGNVIWNATEGGLLSDGPVTFTLYQGHEDQDPDALIVADKGADRVPGFRGLRYIVFTDLPLAEIGSGSPVISATFTKASGRVAVADILTFIATAGGSASTVENIADLGDGAVISSDITLQQFFHDLQGFYNFSIKDAVSPLTLTRRDISGGVTPDATYLASDLVTDQENNASVPAITFNRAEATEVSNQIEAQYIDASVNYTTTTQLARWPHFPVNTINSSLVQTLQIPIEHTAEEILLYDYDMLSRAKAQQLQLTFSLNDLRPEPGDVLELDCDDDGTYTVLVDQSTLRFDKGINEIVALSLLTQFDVTASADAGDVLSNTVNYTLAAKSWTAITGSSDLSIVVAAANFDYVYGSQSGGVRFAARFEAQLHQWIDADCGSDAIFQFVVNQDGGLWFSPNSGANWFPAGPVALYSRVCCNSSGGGSGAIGLSQPGPAVYPFTANTTGVSADIASSIGLTLDVGESVAGVDCSADGGIIIAVVASAGSPRVAVSTDNGVNFGSPVAITGTPNQLACSDDGSTVIITRTLDPPLISTDGGGSFSEISLVDPGDYMDAVDFSSDGSKAVMVGIAGSSDGFAIYTSSNGGASWTGRTDPLAGGPSNVWRACAISDDGTKVVIGAGIYPSAPSYIYHSEDSGATFTRQVS